MANTSSAAPASRPTEATFKATKNFNVNGMGIFIDRWGDVIDSRAEAAQTIRNSVLQNLQDRNMPNIQIEPVKANAGMLSGEERPYIITTTSPGVTTAIYIAAHGKDLYVSWRTHVRGVFNLRLLAILAALAIVPTLCASPCLAIGGVVNSLNQPFGGGGGVNIGNVIGPILGAGIGFFIFELLLVAAAGYFFRGNFLAFFFVEPSVFDAEDVAAMSLTVHRSIQDAVKKAGIEASMLLSKTEFKGGRKSEAT